MDGAIVVSMDVVVIEERFWFRSGSGDELLVLAVAVAERRGRLSYLRRDESRTAMGDPGYTREAP